MTSHFRASDAKKLSSEVKRAAKQAANQSAAYTRGRRRRRRKTNAVLSRVRMHIFQSAIDGQKSVALKMSMPSGVQTQLCVDGFRVIGSHHEDRTKHDDPTVIYWDHWGNITVFRKGTGNSLVVGEYMFWICSGEGQYLLSQFSRLIKDFVERGHKYIEIVTVKLSHRGSDAPAIEGDLSAVYAPKIELRVEDQVIAQVPLNPILVCRLFSYLGYKSTLTGENTKKERIRLRW